MTFHWYALRSKPQKEELVWKQLISRGIECFYPRMRVHPVNPRSRKVKPYFPGYLFIHVDLEDVGVSPLKWMPHTLGIVSFGDEPASVPDHLINALNKKIKEINEAGGELFEGLKKGDKIWIHTGPFSGYEAIFDHRLPGKERVKVLLQFLEEPRKVPIELDASQIRKEE